RESGGVQRKETPLALLFCSARDRDLRRRVHRRPRADVSGDSPVPRLNELNSALAVHEVRVEGFRQRRRGEVLEGHGKLDRESDLVHQVLQVEKVHVAGEVAEQSEELCVPGERGAQWAGLVKVMSADALQRQIEPVPDTPMASTRLVDRHLAIDL